ncbi:MAG: FAD-dependent oxidoreductase, partial [Comamonadaceae bacterium]|nr:FAD-dependent oxidoreductase [Comamonadaceae bacterium]
MAHIGIAGAGLLGRLLAWQLSPHHEVTVFDPADGPQARSDGQGPAAFTAAGMLSPLAELDNSGPAIAALGWRSMALWREITDALAQAGTAHTSALPAACGSCTGCAPPVGQTEASSLQLRTLGSLLVAHGSDLGAAQRVLARLAQAPDLAGVVPTPQRLDRASLTTLEPALDPRLHAWLLPGEGQILPLQVLPALCAAAPRVHWRWRHTVASVRPACITLDNGTEQCFDLAIDVRGTGARPDLPVR